MKFDIIYYGIYHLYYHILSYVIHFPLNCIWVVCDCGCYQNDSLAYVILTYNWNSTSRIMKYNIYVIIYHHMWFISSQLHRSSLCRWMLSGWWQHWNMYWQWCCKLRRYVDFSWLIISHILTKHNNIWPCLVNLLINFE